jgi:hypothetical protein
MLILVTTNIQNLRHHKHTRKFHATHIKANYYVTQNKYQAHGKCLLLLFSVKHMKRMFPPAIPLSII